LFSSQILPSVKFQFIDLLSFRTFLVSARKVPQRSRVKGRFAQMRPLYNPPPHRHPAFKNVPIFERFHAANLKSAPQSPLKIGTFSVGGGQKRRE